MEKTSSKNIAAIINDNDTDDAKMTTETTADIKETKTKVKTPTVKTEVQGVVINCLALNVRQEPDITGTVVATITNGSLVLIDESTSNDRFYGITTNDKISGFCKKEFIKIK